MTKGQACLREDHLILLALRMIGVPESECVARTGGPCPDWLGAFFGTRLNAARRVDEQQAPGVGELGRPGVLAVVRNGGDLAAIESEPIRR